MAAPLDCDEFMMFWLQNINLQLETVELVLKAKKMRELAHQRRLQAQKLINICIAYHVQPKRIWSFPKTQEWWMNVALQMSPRRFKENFRITKETYSFLSQVLEEAMKKKDTKWRKAIPVGKRIAIALYTLASSEEYRTIASLFGVGKSTVHYILLDFCQAVRAKLLRETIRFPSTAEDIGFATKKFEDTWRFPQCLSAIDGCHVEVSPPFNEAVDHHNYKGWYSFVLLAAVDAQCRFTYINVGSAGGNNDAHIFSRSRLFEIVKTESTSAALLKKTICGTEIPTLIIGDEAFPLMPRLMKPYADDGNLDDKKKRYNFRIGSACRVAENAFGRLKARFRCMAKRLGQNLQNSTSIVETCCVLHNLCEARGDTIKARWLDESGTALSSLAQPQQICVVGDSNRIANDIRNSICESLS